MFKVFNPLWDQVLMKESDSFWVPYSRTLVIRPIPLMIPNISEPVLLSEHAVQSHSPVKKDYFW